MIQTLGCDIQGVRDECSPSRLRAVVVGFLTSVKTLPEPVQEGKRGWVGGDGRGRGCIEDEGIGQGCFAGFGVEEGAEGVAEQTMDGRVVMLEETVWKCEYQVRGSFSKVGYEEDSLCKLSSKVTSRMTSSSLASCRDLVS